MQFLRGGRRWLLKSPQHLEQLPVLDRVFPGCHRRVHAPRPGAGGAVDDRDDHLLRAHAPHPGAGRTRSRASWVDRLDADARRVRPRPRRHRTGALDRRPLRRLHGRRASRSPSRCTPGRRTPRRRGAGGDDRLSRRAPARPARHGGDVAEMFGLDDRTCANRSPRTSRASWPDFPPRADAKVRGFLDFAGASVCSEGGVPSSSRCSVCGAATRGISQRGPSAARKAQMTAAPARLDPRHIAEAQRIVGAVGDAFSAKVVGQHHLRESLLIGLLAGGHILIESVPGLAKTTAARVIAESIHGGFQRIQCTPDLLPSDIIGTQIYESATNSFVTATRPGAHQHRAARRDQPLQRQDAERDARGDGGTSDHHRGPRVPDPRAVSGDRHPEPGRPGRHLSALGGADRPIHAQGRRVVSVVRTKRSR